MSQSSVRIPPDSTGKKIATVNRTIIGFDNQSNPMTIGDVVIGVSSGATGIITAISTEGFSVGTGELFLHEVTGTFVDNEELQVAATTVCDTNLTSGTGTVQSEFEVQKMVIADPDNPDQIQRIDRFGATLNTFTDGAPVFDPFGSMTVGEKHKIKDYKFAYNDLPKEFYSYAVGGGTATYESVSGCSLLTCGTASGDKICRTTHFYHPYSPGIGQLIQMTCRIGDAGKVGVRRRWGYYDDNDGVFWELDGTDLYVVLRSSVSGSVVDTRIPQSEFSLDRLDGSDDIGFDLDVSKPNIYFIDLQWLGAGRIRFGVSEPEGAQLAAHVVENSNKSNIYPYMRTATLPFRYDQENIGTSGSTSEMRIACATIMHTSEVRLSGNIQNHEVGFMNIADTDNEKYIFGIRPKDQFNGIDNHALIKVEAISLSNTVVTGNQPVLFRLYSGVDVDLTGTSWASKSADSIAEHDTSSTTTSFTNFDLVATLALAPNGSLYQNSFTSELIHALELFNIGTPGVRPVFILTAEVGGVGECMISAAAGWEELLE